VRTLAKTVQGRDFIVAFIADPATLANLPRYQRIQRKLMDPRKRTAGERAAAARRGEERHPHHVEHPQHRGRRLPHAVRDRRPPGRGNTRGEVDPVQHDHHARAVQNPDGVDIVGNWYRSTLGTPAEGMQPPELYHYYTGHDNNRDWYAFTQPETRYTVDSLYTPWDPQIVNDVHQQGANAGRIFIPPYMDPLEPNIDPILTSATNALGMAMAWRMTAEGKTGIATNASYDQWSPARQYSLNHRGARILTETASARLATAINMCRSAPWGRGAATMPRSRAGTSRQHLARRPLGDRRHRAYQSSASWALLAQAARDRRSWLEGYATMGERALAAEHPWTIDSAVPDGVRDSQAAEGRPGGAAPHLDAAARAGGDS
jgi:hypothetical protein